MAKPIVSIGDALLAFPGASGSLLALIEADPTISGSVATNMERRHDMLRWIAGLEYSRELPRRMNVTLRVAADVVGYLRDVVAETESTTVVLELPTATSPRRHRLAALASQMAIDPPADLLFVRSHSGSLGREIAPRSILVPIRGGPSARIVIATASAIASAFGSALTLLHVESDFQHPDRSRRERRAFERIVDEMDRPSTAVNLVRGEAPARIILERSAGHDLVIMGSWLNPERPSVLVGRNLMRAVNRMRCPVIVVRSNRAAGGTPPRAAQLVQLRGRL
ncbi:MAG TPA: universal stress protein [Patescibacteria group bacterium]|nr:universal stress protein [Patescibacteria group bacterium]